MTAKPRTAAQARATADAVARLLPGASCAEWRGRSVGLKAAAMARREGWWERAKDLVAALVPVAPTDPQLLLSAIDVHPFCWLALGVMLFSSSGSQGSKGGNAVRGQEKA